MREIAKYPGYFITETGEVFDLKGEQRPVYLSGVPKYKYVNLPADTKSGWQIRRVHILVAETYIPNPHNLPMVDHKDRDKLNNHKDNLQWATRSTNSRNTNRSASVEWEGRSLTLAELVDELYGMQKPHYAYIWRRMQLGDTLEVAVAKNKNYRGR